jgi:hypothetical protein
MRKLKRAHQKFLKQQQKKQTKLRKYTITTSTAAVIIFGAAGLHRAVADIPTDPHQLLVQNDTDKDFLSNIEESQFGSNPFEHDQNLNDILDGVELSMQCKAAIDMLPWENEALPGQTYKQWLPQYGLHTCDICGFTIAMGPGLVVNPQENITVNLPAFQLQLHYMEHGSFEFSGTDSSNPVQGRTEVVLLLNALNIELPNIITQHLLPVQDDSDDDYLTDKEETSIGYNPFNENQNNNYLFDGPELAAHCWQLIENLPWQEQALPGQTYKWHEEQRGLETCPICGIQVNMGPAGIVNPKLSLQIDCPLITMHYMEHGSFSYQGDIHEGRIDIPLLLRILETHYPDGPNDHQLPVDGNDLDLDMITNMEELETSLNIYDSDQDDNISLDGIQIAKELEQVVDELPTWNDIGQEPNEVYKIEHAVDGLEQCDVCGQWIHMGGWEIVNPGLGLCYPDSSDPMNQSFLPDIALHYMEHGSLNCSGSIHKGRIDLALLYKVLEMPRRCGHLGTIYLPGDSNRDCKENLKDFAGFAEHWLESTDPE